MQEITSSQVIDFVKSPVFIFVFAWLVREIYALSRAKVTSLEDSINKLTISIVRLETQLESLTKSVELLPKLRGDVDVVFSRLREINPKSNA